MKTRTLFFFAHAALSCFIYKWTYLYMRAYDCICRQVHTRPYVIIQNILGFVQYEIQIFITRVMWHFSIWFYSLEVYLGSVYAKKLYIVIHVTHAAANTGVTQHHPFIVRLVVRSITSYLYYYFSRHAHFTQNFFIYIKVADVITRFIDIYDVRQIYSAWLLWLVQFHHMSIGYWVLICHCHGLLFWYFPRYRYIVLNIWNVSCAREAHSFSTHERMFLWKCRSFIKRKYLDLRGLEPPTFGFMPNALSTWAIRARPYSHYSHTLEYWFWQHRYFCSQVNVFSQQKRQSVTNFLFCRYVNMEIHRVFCSSHNMFAMLQGIQMLLIFHLRHERKVWYICVYMYIYLYIYICSYFGAVKDCIAQANISCVFKS